MKTNKTKIGQLAEGMTRVQRDHRCWYRITDAEGPKLLDRTGNRILRMLKGWDITAIEFLLVHRVLAEAKRRAKLP